MNIERPELNLGEYEELATSKKYRRPDGPIDFIEQRFVVTFLCSKIGVFAIAYLFVDTKVSS